MRRWWILGALPWACVDPAQVEKDAEEAAEEAWADACGVACERLYAETECNVQIPGRFYEFLAADCMEGCEALFGEEGEAGGYDPYTADADLEDVERALENQAQAELWMECVTARSCEELDDGNCVPMVW